MDEETVSVETILEEMTRGHEMMGPTAVVLSSVPGIDGGLSVSTDNDQLVASAAHSLAAMVLDGADKGAIQKRFVKEFRRFASSRGTRSEPGRHVVVERPEEAGKNPGWYDPKRSLDDNTKLAGGLMTVVVEYVQAPTLVVCDIPESDRTAHKRGDELSVEESVTLIAAFVASRARSRAHQKELLNAFLQEFSDVVQLGQTPGEEGRFIRWS